MEGALSIRLKNVCKNMAAASCRIFGKSVNTIQIYLYLVRERGPREQERTDRVNNHDNQS